MARVEPRSIGGLEIVSVFTTVDDRGALTRAWPLSSCPDEHQAIEQVLISRNVSAFTLRGIHFQRGEHAEHKIVSVIRGRALDVVVDLRPDSVTYLSWAAVELDAEDPSAICIPRGLAHGFLTLVPDTEITYVIDQPYVSAAGAGVAWDDPLIGVDWPAEPQVVSPQDRSWPHLEYGFSPFTD